MFEMCSSGSIFSFSFSTSWTRPIFIYFPHGRGCGFGKDAQPQVRIHLDMKLSCQIRQGMNGSPQILIANTPRDGHSWSFNGWPPVWFKSDQRWSFQLVRTATYATCWVVVGSPSLGWHVLWLPWRMPTKGPWQAQMTQRVHSRKR